MTRRTASFGAALAAIALAAGPLWGEAQAAPITFTTTGVISVGTDNGTFGVTGSLTGRAYSLTQTFDSANQIRSTVTTGIAQVEYSPASFSVTINGVTFSGSTLAVDAGLSLTDQPGALGVDQISFGQRGPLIPAGTGSVAIFQNVFSVPVDFLPSLDLNQTVTGTTTPDFSSAVSVTATLPSGSFTLVGTVATYALNAGVTPPPPPPPPPTNVPEPASLALLGLGLVGLAAARRRYPARRAA